MANIINASPTNGLVQTADGSGILKIQSNSVTTNALAWVNFNGTGTVAIRSSYNVSSITDNGTGDYTVNFATALSDANYSITGSAGSGNAFGSYCLNNSGAGSRYATTGCRINTFISQAGSVSDVDTVCVSIFGN
jgi:hypothetical protein